MFAVLLYLARQDLRLRGIGLFLTPAAAALAVTFFVEALFPLFVTAIALMDVLLLLMIYGGDIRIRKR